MSQCQVDGCASRASSEVVAGEGRTAQPIAVVCAAHADQISDEVDGWAYVIPLAEAGHTRRPFLERRPRDLTMTRGESDE